MVYTAVLEAVPERVRSSSLLWGTKINEKIYLYYIDATLRIGIIDASSLRCL